MFYESLQRGIYYRLTKIFNTSNTCQIKTLRSFIAIISDLIQYAIHFHRKQETSQIQDFLKTIKCLKAFPTERLLDKHVTGTFFRKERLISDSMEMPRNIHFVESGLAKIVKKVVKNVFILVREIRISIRNFGQNPDHPFLLAHLKEHIKKPLEKIFFALGQ